MTGKHINKTLNANSHRYLVSTTILAKGRYILRIFAVKGREKQHLINGNVELLNYARDEKVH